MQPVDAIIKQIEDALAPYKDGPGFTELRFISQPAGVVADVATRLMACIRRCAPLGSPHRDGAEALVKENGITNGYIVDPLLGILRSLRAEYSAGYFAGVSELIHADLFADFLEMSQHLLSQGYKDPSAVLVGSVLEEHLRKLCLKTGIPVTAGAHHKKADTLNAELDRLGVYNKLDQKSVTAWLDLRNKAAHGNYAEYSKGQVQNMIDWVRGFIGRFPA